MKKTILVMLLLVMMVIVFCSFASATADYKLVNAGTKYGSSTGTVSWLGILPATGAYAGADLVNVTKWNGSVYQPQYTAWMYCVDAVVLNYADNYDRRVGLIPNPNLPQPNATQWGQVAWLVKKYGGSTSTLTGDQAAGLQIAIWKAVSPTSGYGAFGYSGFSAATNTWATTYLAALGSKVASYSDVVVFVDGQNLVQAPDVPVNDPTVPEPMSVILGIMGLGSVAGFMKLRRK